MSVVDYVVAALLLTGLFFYAAGSVGLLRFPNAESRLHALTKADNAGLGLIALAVALYWGSVAVAVKIAAVWLFAILAAGATAQILALAAREDEDGRR